MRGLLWLVSGLVGLALANVEKTMFISPNLDTAQSALLKAELNTLSPLAPSIRAHLDAEFPTDTAPAGKRSWYRLEGLVPGQRYEVRVCWLATQPTEFTLSTYTPSEILQSPNLLASLAEFSELQAHRNQNSTSLGTSIRAAEVTLYLVVDAAADYFTSDKALMANVPPVLVDLILDPYIFNILPTSLVPTLGYVAVSAVLAWFISRYVWLQLSAAAEVLDVDARKESQTQPRSAPVQNNWIGAARKKNNRINFFSC
ncbi:hypothetical protein MGYG_04347 [Nannizzia gypsea CBS 118893]|uniref:Uncharacterized protein n=1 Tax=Arthroderma gypseum (strain ATCC MYA-4604 / CBS 118893) TaxID=535722 RepID=E4USI9_ARTGP|nr:hypothetical protein MGYG_04347 [Nannizzia gypsea CBS 118893]EFR01340.1 hypothetical protein MGYG_04347 [Nannizzia gypsea CBS 118893]